MFEPGTILLDKYRVERVLGKGGMGVVVAVRHAQLGELFALKVLLPESRDQPEALERFLLEARAAAKLKSEHVARVHDVGKLPDGTPYMLMEHLEGEDLSDLLARRRTLPVGEAALYVHQACQAVSKAHANGIVHRDLKPSNLFLTRSSNGSPCVKVLDFGIVKELDPQNRVGKSLTKTGTFLGSPLYMPPEQMADIKLADTRGDVWALGVILYEFLTGSAPFAAEAVTSVITKVLLSHPPAPSHLVPGVPPEFDAIVMRCLEKQPDLRYPTAHELMFDLEPFIKNVEIHEPIESNTSGPISISAKTSPKQLAETMVEPLNAGIVETIAANAAPVPGVTAASISTPLPSADLPAALAKTLGESGSGAVKPRDDRKKLLWGVAIVASFLFVAIVISRSTHTPATQAIMPESSIPQAPLALPDKSSSISNVGLSSIDNPQPETSASNPSRIVNTPDLAASKGSTEKVATVPATNPPVLSKTVSPTATIPPTAKTVRPTTKKTRVPGYDD